MSHGGVSCGSGFFKMLIKDIFSNRIEELTLDLNKTMSRKHSANSDQGFLYINAKLNILNGSIELNKSLYEQFKNSQAVCVSHLDLKDFLSQSLHLQNDSYLQ